MSEGIAECKLFETTGGDGHGLGRRLEYDVMNQMAINRQCQGVHVFRENHPDYDPVQDLHLDYNPGRKVHGWAMIPWKGSQIVVRSIIEGEGTPAQIAQQICTVAKGQGANIH